MGQTIGDEIDYQNGEYIFIVLFFFNFCSLKVPIFFNFIKTIYVMPKYTHEILVF